MALGSSLSRTMASFQYDPELPSSLVRSILPWHLLSFELAGTIPEEYTEYVSAFTLPDMLVAVLH
jgi:hypothetical protein